MVVLDPLSVGIAAKKGGWPDVTIPWVIATSFGESGWDTEAIGNGAAYGDGAGNYLWLGAVLFSAGLIVVLTIIY